MGAVHSPVAGVGGGGGGAVHCPVAEHHRNRTELGPPAQKYSAVSPYRPNEQAANWVGGQKLHQIQPVSCCC